MKETLSKNLKPIVVIMGVIVLVLIAKRVINEKN
jgi:hypothetical protein